MKWEPPVEMAWFGRSAAPIGPTKEVYDSFKNGTTYIVYSHGDIENMKPPTTPANLMVVHTGEICTFTLTDIDKVVRNMFTKPNEETTFDVLSGQENPAYLPEKEQTFFESIKHSLPGTPYIQKRHSYDPVEDKDMLMGVFRLNKDTGRLMKLPWTKTLTKDLEGDGLLTSEILEDIQANHGYRTPCVVVFVSCSVVHEDEIRANVLEEGLTFGTAAPRHTVKRFSQGNRFRQSAPPIIPATPDSAQEVVRRRAAPVPDYTRENRPNIYGLRSRVVQRQTAANRYMPAPRDAPSVSYPYYEVWLRFSTGQIKQYYTGVKPVQFSSPQEVYSFIRNDRDFQKDMNDLLKEGETPEILVRSVEKVGGRPTDSYMEFDSFAKQHTCHDGICKKVMRFFTGSARKRHTKRRHTKRRKTRKHS